ncbi:MAG: sigma-54-dependent Fis family transcriptional regulator [Candidatus Hydrogenedentes bacterium]|nr:sigma-54-dependent Fis family transcriptional regulator [Candidatus Hydrogenedentota bacterium]
MSRILIVDDDDGFASMLSRAIMRLGHEVACVGTRHDALSASGACPYDVIYLDVNLPDGNGLEILPRIRELPSRPEVIIITGSGSPDGAELAMNYGAWDYVAKATSNDAMTLPLIRALQYRDVRGALKSRVFDRSRLVGNSPCLNLCLEAAAQAADSDASALITGETGTGKEIIATLIHENSARRSGNFVVVDCAALPENLVESILFGHVKGSFTGAERDREGLIQQAHNGTLFLDEVGELPEHLQKSFLRVLQERRFRPVGGQQECFSDFRLLAATNRDLNQLAGEGRFRKDLLYRICVLTVQVPPLRCRREDIKTIAIHRIHKLCDECHVAAKGFSPEFFSVLEAYDWPGNVRELLHTLDRVFAVAGSDSVLYPKHLPTGLRISAMQNQAQGEAPTDGRVQSPVAPVKTIQPMRSVRDAAIAAAEEQYLNDLLTFTQGDIQEACRVAELSPSRLYELLKQYNIPRKAYPS